jgi:hypothetical protein
VSFVELLIGCWPKAWPTCWSPVLFEAIPDGVRPSWDIVTFYAQSY